VQDGVIACIGEAPEAAEFYLAPGLIDLQVNGCAGYDLNADGISPETVAGLTDAMLRDGATCFAPTLITASEESLVARLRILAEARRINPTAAACVPFVHVEGPHISPLDGYRGAHPAEHVRPPSIAEFERWQDASGGLVGMVTLSPQFDESCKYIEALVKRGVHMAIGHTHATPEQIRSAVNAGATLSTHLGNGIAREIPRHRNPIWSQLADDRLTAAFIADGHHLPAETLKSMVRAKGVGRSILVSDMVALAGMPAGVYNSPVGGRVELKGDGRLCVFGSDLLAGSAHSLAQCVGRAVKLAGISIGDAIAMATENPGRFVDGRGRISVGARADLVRFRWSGELVPEDVWLGGKCVFARRP
jgi:N-acetylglucosamine-6-phosphate deacetylase